MKRKITIEIELKCDKIPDDLLKDHFDSIVEDIVYNVEELTYCYDDSTGDEYEVRAIVDHTVRELFN